VARARTYTLEGYPARGYIRDRVRYPRLKDYFSVQQLFVTNLLFGGQSASG